MRSPETSRTDARLLAHLAQRLLVGLEAELRDEAQRAHEPQRILARSSAARPCAARRASRSSAAVERVDELAVGEPPRDRVDGEVAPAQVVLDRRVRVDDDLEVVAPGPGRALAPRRRELDPGRRERAQLGRSRG